MLDVAATCPPLDARGVTVSERALFPMDPSHRAMVRLGGASAVLRADEPVAALPIADEPAVDTLATYVGEGVLHIWEGIDHIFFLLALLLPAVLWWRPRAAP
ncbi:MAG: HupE/UreJ family protein [Deltaproteobacteria bacterium]|nr:HupE/UreJ family protein [Deltaproteobacteria bacterium]